MATKPLNVEELQREVDRDRSAKVSRQGEALAKETGMSIEELDRRMQSIDNKRDASGLPPLAPTQVAERVRVDDFGKEEEPTPKADTAAKEGKSSGRSMTERTRDPEDKLELDAQRLRSEQVRREALEVMIGKRFIQTGGKYVSRDSGNRVAFEEAGTKLTTRNSDEFTAASMAMVAEAKGWTSLKVKGQPEFKQAMWMEAQLRGIQVKGYTPTELDQALLADKLEKQQLNKPAPAPEKQPSTEKSAGEPRKEPARKVVENVAQALVLAKIVNPDVRDRVMQEINRRLDAGSEKKSPVPELNMYDVKAAAGRQVEPVALKDRNAERSR